MNRAPIEKIKRFSKFALRSLPLKFILSKRTGSEASGFLWFLFVFVLNLASNSLMAAESGENIAVSGASDLNLIHQARRSISNKKFKEASKIYAQIGFKHPHWAKRIEDSIRFNFGNKKYTESWRIAQIAKRSSTKFPELDYYLAVSATKAGACPLGIRVENKPWRSLLYAHAYRFPQRFRLEKYYAEPKQDAANGIIQTYLGPNRTFYLPDIARAKVLKKLGCRFVKSRLQNRSVAAFHEFRHLNDWFKHYSNQSAEKSDKKHEKKAEPGSHEVRLRLMELAYKQDQTIILSKLLEFYSEFTTQDWLKVKSPENQFIWQKMVEAQVIEKLPLAIDHEFGRHVEAIILNSKSPKAVYWLGMVDYDQWPVDRQLKVVNHLLDIKKIKMKNYLYQHKAWLLYFLGKMQESLAVVRELTIEGASDDIEEIDKSVTDLAVSIFSEYRYDKKMMGAIQSSLPVQFWGSVFRGVLIDGALSGNRKSYKVVKSLLVETRKTRSTGLTKKHIAALDLILQRNLRGFHKHIMKWKRKRGISGEFIRFSEFLSYQIFLLPEAKRRKVEPYLLEVAAMLQSAMGRTSDHRRLEEMISIFDPTRKFPWSKGSSSVKRGSVKVGIVNLRSTTNLHRPYPWKAPSGLPLRDLLVVPTKQFTPLASELTESSSNLETWIIK